MDRKDEFVADLLAASARRPPCCMYVGPGTAAQQQVQELLLQTRMQQMIIQLDHSTTVFPSCTLERRSSRKATDSRAPAADTNAVKNYLRGTLMDCKHEFVAGLLAAPADHLVADMCIRHGTATQQQVQELLP